MQPSIDEHPIKECLSEAPCVLLEACVVEQPIEKRYFLEARHKLRSHLDVMFARRKAETVFVVRELYHGFSFALTLKKESCARQGTGEE